MKYIITVIVLALVGSVSVVKRYASRRRDSGKSCRKDEKTDEPVKNGGERLDEHGEAHERFLPSLVPIIKFFKGQCNSFKKISETPRDIERCARVFEYTEKVIGFHADVDLKNWWNDFVSTRSQWDLELYKENATQILFMIKEAGVTSSTERVITWNDNASRHYVSLEDLDNGDVCDVILPCWIYCNEVFEQGMVAKRVNR